jgi:hypothetical protein
LVLPLLGLSLLAAKAMASGPEAASGGPEAAITRAAAAPFQDALRHDAATLCGDFVPAVAAELVHGTAGAGGCTAAASREFALTAPNEPPTATGLSLTPTVHDLEVAGQHATLELSFTFLTISKKPGTTKVAIHHAGPIKLGLKEVGGAWLVSSRARLSTVPGCRLPKPDRCSHGARVLIFLAGEIAPTQPGEALPIPVIPQHGVGNQHEVETGRLEVARSGCLACHLIGDNGNRGQAGTSRTSARSSPNASSPMPSWTRKHRCHRSTTFPPRSSTTSCDFSPHCDRYLLAGISSI